MANTIPRKHRLYVDEVGNHDLDPGQIKPAERYLSLTGVIFDLEYIRVTVSPEVEGLKVKHFDSHPDDPVVLHRKEIVQKKPPFRVLRQPERCAAFDSDLLNILSDLDYAVITVVIDKWRAYEMYGKRTDHPYHYCMEALVERYVHELRARQAVGDVLAESRGGREDTALKAAFAAFYRGGTSALGGSKFRAQLTSGELKVRPRSDNIAGLQVADMLAAPAFRAIMATRSKQPLSNDMTGTIGTILVRSKFRRKSDGTVTGYGTKWLP